MMIIKKLLLLLLLHPIHSPISPCPCPGHRRNIRSGRNKAQRLQLSNQTGIGKRFSWKLEILCSTPINACFVYVLNGIFHGILECWNLAPTELQVVVAKFGVQLRPPTKPVLLEPTQRIQKTKLR